MYLGIPELMILRGQNESRMDSKVLTTLEKPGPFPGETQMWQNEELEIPSVPPSRLHGCQIIDIKYHLHVSTLYIYVAVNTPKWSQMHSLIIMFNQNYVK